VNIPEHVDRSRLHVSTSANPGRWAAIEGMIVKDEDGSLWIAGPQSEERLDRAIWKAFHVDPDDFILGRLRVTVEAV
jgi:hypothetical protein